MPQIISIEQCISTNGWIESELKKAPLDEGFMVRSKFQSGGRGQGQNDWEGEHGKNLLCSTLLKPTFLSPVEQFQISRCAALACYDTLASYNVQELSLKWPNDIYFQDKKLGGILIENSLMGNVFGHCIVGIGININQTEFHSHAPNPVSLVHILNKTIDIQLVAETLQQNILFWYGKLREGNLALIEEAYQKRLYRRDGSWTFSRDGETFTASILDVESTGRLVLKTQSGIKKFWFKEIEFVIDSNS